MIVELPLRDQATRDMVATFQDLMIHAGFVVLEDGQDFGFDDWEENGERAQVEAWWGVWHLGITV